VGAGLYQWFAAASAPFRENHEEIELLDYSSCTSMRWFRKKSEQ